MIRKKILIVAPYPIAKPYHGGQKRAKALFNYYKSLFLEAKFVGVFHRGQYPDWGNDDILLGQPDIIKEVDEKPYASELITGRAIYKDIHVRSHMAKLLMEYIPDIIHIEQPFPYLGLSVLLTELNIHPKIIFGSQNIEYSLKDRIFKEFKIPLEISESLTQQTKKLEIDLSQKANLVIAVNNEDAKVHRGMGAKRCIVIPNGIDKVPVSKHAADYWRNLSKKEGINNIVLFVGSGHPPNWEGFLKFVGDNTEFIPARSKIFVAGGVAEYFAQHYRYKNRHAKFWSGVKYIGQLEEDRLSALLHVCDLIILPITTKRGSNLKTAEAILSRKKIVSSTNAFKGFEQYRKLPNIYIANSREDFQTSILTALKAEYINPTTAELQLSEQVQWKYCLKPLEKEVRRVIRGIYLKEVLHIVKKPLSVARASIGRVKNSR